MPAYVIADVSVSVLKHFPSHVVPSPAAAAAAAGRFLVRGDRAAVRFGEIMVDGIAREARA